MNSTDAVMQVLADEGLLAEVPQAQEYRLSSRITAALGAPITRGDRVRWGAVASEALVVFVRPRAATIAVYVSPDYDPANIVAVDLKELTRA